jgi:acetoin utilization deacetylase AcuC-like enzyme
VVVSGGSSQDEADGRYLDELDELLAEAPKDANLVLYNAGMDPHPGVSSEALAERERRVADWRAETGVPLAFVLAGGYLGALDQDELVDLHLHTVRAFAGTGLDAAPMTCHGLPLPNRSRTLEHSRS